MAQFNLEDYNDVATRVQQFRKDHPNGHILSELISNDGKNIIIRAEVYYTNDQARPNGVGYAEEIRGQGYINKTSALENAETSAWGRALAACGYATKKIASVDEINIAKGKEQTIEANKRAQKEQEYQDALAREEQVFKKNVDNENKKAIWNLTQEWLDATNQDAGKWPSPKEAIQEFLSYAGAAVEDVSTLSGNELGKTRHKAEAFKERNFTPSAEQELEGLGLIELNN